MSPVVKLDIDLSPEPDWFPADLLQPDKFQANLNGSNGGASGSGSRTGNAKAGEVGEDRKGRQTRDGEGISTAGDDQLTGDESYDDEGSMFALEDVMDVDLETQMDVREFCVVSIFRFKHICPVIAVSKICGVITEEVVREFKHSLRFY